MAAEIQFQNTLTGKKEPFVPLHPPEVRMYTCGPTVYDFAHIGNFRTFTFQDILRRFLRQRGYQVNQVMNLTDVDDRIIQNAAQRGIGIREYTDQYIKVFLEDCAALSLERPEQVIRATDHIDDMVKLIQRLSEKSLTYTSDGSIYYRIAKFPQYGKLSKIDMSGIQPGARVEVDRYEKADARDFALWKAPKPGEHFWETPIGPGRPGWHIECSAMAMRYLGETLDIHTGGVDLTFPHHENEIAQSEAATGKTFVRYWLHAEHLNIEGEKMSKSLGNFYTLRELFEQGHKPSSIRFLLASVPYRRQLTFSLDGLQQAASSVERLRNLHFRLNLELASKTLPPGSDSQLSDRVAKALEEFDAGLADDLNTAKALGAIFTLVREVNPLLESKSLPEGNAQEVLALLENFDHIFAVLRDPTPEKDIVQASAIPLEPELLRLIDERQAARKRRDFKRADEIRQQLAGKGITLEDTKDGGVRWKRT